MPPLPIISADECLRALRQFGYEVARQKGSHVRLVSAGRKPVTVPRHKILKRGTLKSILRECEIGVAEFLQALER
jgi:predicted RNA binding protein YcfA (HicA-like mRNA interferase family)